MTKKMFNHANGEELNDGILIYGNKITIRDGVTKEYIDSTFEEVGRLFYAVKTVVSEDIKHYFGIDTTVDLKIKVYNIHKLDTTQLVYIKGDYYDITKIDPSNDDLHAFLYLQKRKGL